MVPVVGRPDRIINCEYPLHITARTNNREPFPIELDAIWEILSDYLHMARTGFGVRTHSFLLMPNHFHLIARDPEGAISECMQYFMRETSKEIGRHAGRINRIWGARFHSSIIGSPLYFLHAYKYVYRNPVRAGISSNVLEYRYSTLQALFGRQRSIIPIEEDELLLNDVEGTLSWLDFGYSGDEERSIQLALRRRDMQFPREKKTSHVNPLDTWSSVPPAMQHYKK